MSDLSNIIGNLAGAAPRLIRTAQGLVGVLRDSIRLGQYDLGAPYWFGSGLQMAPGATGPLAFPQRISAEIRSIIPWCVNVSSPATDDTPQINFRSIATGATIYYENIGNVLMPVFYSPPTLNGVQAQINGVRLPFQSDGFGRRFFVRQNNQWQVDVVNNSTNDTYDVGILIECYSPFGTKEGRR